MTAQSQNPSCLTTKKGNLLIFFPSLNQYIYLDRLLEWMKTSFEDKTGLATTEKSWNRLTESNPTSLRNASGKEIKAAKTALQKRDAFFTQKQQGQIQLQKFYNRYGKFKQKVA